MVWYAVTFFALAAAFGVLTLIGPRRLFEHGPRWYRDSDAAAQRALTPSDQAFRYGRVAQGVAAVIMLLGGWYVLDRADDFDDEPAEASAEEVRAAAERAADAVDGNQRLATEPGHDAVDIERALGPDLLVEENGAAFTITNTEGEHPVCLLIDERVADSPPSIDDLPPYVDEELAREAARSIVRVTLSTSVRAGAC
ncbi:hypothetical protein E1265_14155 [Streptomyces sp. 8K308]|uniref:hypothetical protein n=1 Tax=Streptomyces sp. 8K308 TaxID=2530388 RepID=UPI0010478729|nr:hypothetical protein [Streptomyces sp. 8K308]TDC22982.1 hypothetical protein E1265_14155 [Streptomyces sp. 8K308]